MAVVGQALTAPEAGWQRIGSSNTNFMYVGTWVTNTNALYYNGAQKGTSELNAKIVFRFTGTKLRIITDSYPSTHSQNVQISIDNEVSSISLDAPANFQRLSYEKLNLPLQVHTVVITNLTNKGAGFSGIDIDDTGEMEPILIAMPMNLIATGGDSQISLLWDVINGATGYNIKRSMTPGGPYTAIATNVQTNSYLDTEVVNGTTYYYVVTAISVYGESDPSNEASATPQAQGKAILLIELTDGLQKEYELTKAEVDAFIAWYDNRDAGNGGPYYVVDKAFNLGPFQSRKDYIVFEKIQNFEVMAFEE